MEEIDVLRTSSEDLIWFLKNLSDLKKNFLGKSIAIKNKSVLADASSVKNLLNKLSSQDINSDEVLIKQVGSEKEIVIF